MANALEETQEQEHVKNLVEGNIEINLPCEMTTVTVLGKASTEKEDNTVVESLCAASGLAMKEITRTVTDIVKTEIQDAVDEVADEKMECIVKGPAAQVKDS